MSPRGGKREGAGRPSRGWEDKTKVAVDIDTHQIIKNYAKSLGIPVIDLMYDIFHHPNFKYLIERLKIDAKRNSEE